MAERHKFVYHGRFAYHMVEMLSKGEFLVRFASIMADYTAVMQTSDMSDPTQVVVDGKRLLGVIEGLTSLVSEMHDQMGWPPEQVSVGLPYN